MNPNILSPDIRGTDIILKLAEAFWQLFLMALGFIAHKLDVVGRCRCISYLTPPHMAVNTTSLSPFELILGKSFYTLLGEMRSSETCAIIIANTSLVF